MFEKMWGLLYPITQSHNYQYLGLRRQYYIWRNAKKQCLDCLILAGIFISAAVAGLALPFFPNECAVGIMATGICFLGCAAITVHCYKIGTFPKE